jgi:hypothetical protein
VVFLVLLCPDAGLAGRLAHSGHAMLPIVARWVARTHDVLSGVAGACRPAAAVIEIFFTGEVLAGSFGGPARLLPGPATGRPAPTVRGHEEKRRLHAACSAGVVLYNVAFADLLGQMLGHDAKNRNKMKKYQHVMCQQRRTG